MQFCLALSFPFSVSTWHIYKHCQPHRLDRRAGKRKFFCIIIIAIFFIARVIIVEQVKENGGMASCSGLLGSPPSLGRIAFGKSDQSQKKYLGANIIFLTVKNKKGRS